MKMAVTYENGEIFRHFGKTEHFKIYEIEDGKVISAEVIGTGGTGHEALADFLAAQGVAAVICGGLGDGAQAALWFFRFLSEPTEFSTLKFWHGSVQIWF